MLEELNNRLVETKQRLRQKQKLQAMLSETEQMLRDQEQKHWAMRQRLNKEKADVDRLEGFSLAGLFYSVLGTKRERIDDEKKEYAAAKLKSDESAQAVQECREDVDRLRHELSIFEGIDKEYERAIEEKERLLAGGGDGRAKRLLDLSERLTGLKADAKELKEAIDAGQAAVDELGRVQSALHSAENWGTWDMFGGGFMATMAKHSQIDTAKDYARSAQSYLRRFQEELADAGERLHVSLDIGGFSKFADYFFDGLIADWVVQSKIQNASSACASAVAQVTAALSNCRRRLSETEADLDKVGLERRAFIESA